MADKTVGDLMTERAKAKSATGRSSTDSEVIEDHEIRLNLGLKDMRGLIQKREVPIEVKSLDGNQTFRIILAYKPNLIK